MISESSAFADSVQRRIAMRYDRGCLIENKIPTPETGIEIRKTICAICSGNCGVNAYVKDDKVVKVEGMPEFPPSLGTLCAKGNANRQYIYNADRVLTPLRRVGERGSGSFTPISWDQAYAEIAEKLLKIKAETGPEAVVIGVGYTKWLRPFAQRLGISFGTPNFATESSSCYFATSMAAKLTYGCWGAPDIKNADCLLIWSKNIFASGTFSAKKLIDAREKGLKIIEVSPMVTHQTRFADIRLGLRPGTDGALALGMANVIISENLHDTAFVERWTMGFDAYKTYVRQFTPEITESITGVPAHLIQAAARLFATSKGSCIMTSASPTVHHTNGVQNHRAIICLSGLTGNFDAPGGNYVVPETWVHTGTGFRTRQDEFMYPRPFDSMPPRVGQDKFPVWAELVPESQAMCLADQIQNAKPYPVKALIAFGYNHRMWPGSDALTASLKKLDFFVDIDPFMTDTAQLADIVLPACSSFERSELRFYPGNHVIYTQPVIPPVGQSKSDSEIIFELAKYIAPDDDLMGHGYEACLDWILEPSGLTIEELKKHPAGMTVKNLTMPGYRKYLQEGFATPSGKMEFTSGRLQEAGHDALPVYREPALSPVSRPEVADQYPLVLGTGTRLPMYIHSRTFRNSWNRSLHPQPTVTINAADAARRGIANGDEVQLSTPRHAIQVRAAVTGTIPPGVANIYHGWPDVEVNHLIDPDYLDPISGFPGYKSLVCEVQKTARKDGIR
jgi:anaerobic selenocysteine-containing dehydrogenase